MKKTNKENPLTTFRKLNQARQGMVMKSLKKAQDGIETNSDLINKAGSKGGYKKSLQKDKPWEGPVELIKPEKWWAKDYEILSKNKPWGEINSADPYGILNQTNSITPEMANKVYEGPRSVRNVQGKGIRQSADTLQKVEKQKKGGSVKRKK